jgi:hypothetical protein
VAVEDARAGQRVSVPDLDGIVAKTGNDLCVVVLKAIDTLGIFRSEIKMLQYLLKAQFNTFNQMIYEGVPNTVHVKGMLTRLGTHKT